MLQSMKYYFVKWHGAWTVAVCETFTSNEEVWSIIGSDESFNRKDFESVGREIILPNS